MALSKQSTLDFPPITEKPHQVVDHDVYSDILVNTFCSVSNEKMLHLALKCNESCKTLIAFSVILHMMEINAFDFITSFNLK